LAPDQIPFDASIQWSQKNAWTQKNPPRQLGGNWDLLENLDTIDGSLLTSFRQHFLDGVNWTETYLFRSLTQRINKGLPTGGPKTSDELTRWLDQWDELAIRAKLHDHNSTGSATSESWPEIPIAIRRDGRFAVLENAPTVALATVLGIAKIPCRVVMRHSKWLEFCREFLCHSETLHEGRPYQPCTHVDLANLSSSWSEQRFQLIQECLKGGRGRLMDIGANLGYFCHRAEEIGYDCVAVDPCPKLAFFMERLKQAENKHFEVLCRSILEHPFQESYDVILALNIFHHFLKKEDRHQQLVAMLGRIKTKEMIFQSHNAHEAQMVGAYRNYSPNEFVQFILDHSCLKTAEYIGSDQERPLFRLRAA
jgi:2-polyprenyl-3-methyl-5-hydroxy-6-metoxy-1,4-benzoquinol methylase